MKRRGTEGLKIVVNMGKIKVKQNYISSKYCWDANKLHDKTSEQKTRGEMISTRTNIFLHEVRHTGVD